MTKKRRNNTPKILFFLAQYYIVNQKIQTNVLIFLL